MYGTGKGITATQYAENLRKGRAALTQDHVAAPIVGARCTAAEFAALRANKGRT